METDIVHNIDNIKVFRDGIIKKDSINLIVADPPYFKVIGEKWDYQWRTEEEYLEWSKNWLTEAYDVLKKGGTLYLFGYFRMLAKLIPIVEDLGFEVRQQIVINKGIKAISGRATKNYKMFPNVTESILFLVKDSKPFIREFLKSRQKELGLKSKEINELLGVKSNGGGMWSIYTGNNVCKQVPTKEMWDKLRDVLKFELPYEDVKMTFNIEMGITDVWDDIDFYKEKRIHPTQKPVELIERLILASSDEGDVVLDPFSGSGSTAIACLNNNRKYICTEIDTEYYEKSLTRIANYEYKIVGKNKHNQIKIGNQITLL